MDFCPECNARMSDDVEVVHERGRAVHQYSCSCCAYTVRRAMRDDESFHWDDPDSDDEMDDEDYEDLTDDYEED